MAYVPRGARTGARTLCVDQEKDFVWETRGFRHADWWNVQVSGKEWFCVGCHIYSLCGGYILEYLSECTCEQKVRNLFRNWSDPMESLLVPGYS